MTASGHRCGGFCSNHRLCRIGRSPRCGCCSGPTIGFWCRFALAGAMFLVEATCCPGGAAPGIARRGDYRLCGSPFRLAAPKTAVPKGMKEEDALDRAVAVREETGPRDGRRRWVCSGEGFDKAVRRSLCPSRADLRGTRDRRADRPTERQVDAIRLSAGKKAG